MSDKLYFSVATKNNLIIGLLKLESNQLRDLKRENNSTMIQFIKSPVAY